MANVKLILRHQNKDSNGLVPIYIRITHHRKSKYLSLGVKINPEKDWDEKRLRVKKHFPNSTRVNNYIANKVAEVESTALDLASSKERFTSLNIKELIMGKPPECFFEFSDAQVARLETAGQIRTAIRYKGVVKKLRDYRKGKSFTFDDFTVSFLHDYESHLMSIGNSTNTIHTNIKTLRAILYKAIREDRFEQGKNPFFKFKLKKAPTSKERLTLEEINRMKTVDLNPNHMIYHARNAFLFSFYCAGIRIGDILQMRWVNIDNDYLSYKMSKTGQFRKVKMVKQARSILDIYKQTKTEDSIFIFPFLSNLEELNDPDRLYRRLSSLTAMINLRLKKIALLADIDKKLSSHIARHSFADIARKKGMKIYDISKALGHTSLAIAEKYLSGFDDDALEGAIERIFD